MNSKLRLLTLTSIATLALSFTSVSMAAQIVPSINSAKTAHYIVLSKVEHAGKAYSQPATTNTLKGPYSKGSYGNQTKAPYKKGTYGNQLKGPVQKR